MIDVGRVCMKIAGRDAGKLCVVVEVQDESFVVIDGATRRRKCNVRHLEPLEQVLEIKSGADHAAVVSAFEKMGVSIAEKKSKAKMTRPASKRVAKSKQQKEPAKPKKAAKAPAKKAAKKTAKKKETSEKPQAPKKE